MPDEPEIIHPLARKPANEPDYTNYTPPPPVPWSERLNRMRRIWPIWTLIAVNVAVFILGGISDKDIMRQALAGGNMPARVREMGEFWRLLTAMFLHGGFIHLGFNMLSLFNIGALVEMMLGHRRFLTVYFLSGLGGSLMSVMLSEYRGVSVGASGAIFGLIGVVISIFYQHRKKLSSAGREIWRTLIFSALLTLGIGIIPGSIIDNWGHLGGFLVGLALGYVIQWPQSLAPMPSSDDASSSMSESSDK